MSDVNFGADQTADPFDEVVETGDFDAGEAGAEETGSDIIEESDDSDSGVEDQAVAEDTDEVEEEAGVEEESESEEAEEEESESQEDEKVEEESDADDEAEESEEGQDDEGRSDDLAKAIEDGSLEVEVGEGKATLKELKDDYIGRQEVARRFSDLDVQKKAHARDVEEIENYINEFAGLMRKGDAMGAMSYFGDFSGMPAHQVKEALIMQLGPEIVRRQSMTPQEIQAEYLQAENKYLYEQRESEAEIRAKEQADHALQSSIQNLRETHSIAEQEWSEVESELRETLDEGTELSPENIVEAVQLKRDFTMAEKVFEPLSGQFNEAQSDEFFDQLLAVKQKYPHFTEEDLKEVAETAIEQIKQTSTKSKLEKKVAEKKKIQPKKKIKQISQSEDDGIDPELEDWL